MKKWIEQITRKPLWVNMVFAFLLVVTLVFLFFGSLNWITGFGKTQKVPSVTGQNVQAAIKMLEASGLEVVIQDSVFIDTLAKQAVVRQIPDAESIVKTGRTIYLTINRSIPPQVEMPNLTGFSLKSAEMFLLSLGLKMGNISYRPDIARNAVLEQLLGDRPIAPGTKIPTGTVINFVLGSGEGSGELEVPQLVGLTFEAAKLMLQGMNINIGAVVALNPISDSASSFIVKQSPAALSDSLDMSGFRLPNKMKAGQLMDLFLSTTPPAPTDSTQSQY
ncbi:MAG: PASTA domain-containing protein [Chitinophagaceae bacterium]|jgi:beta-lactam-binding protein with PASTA domain|nr:PASTA domain-containing protein [Chitinophagaceae bacterium]MCA6481294.1 PASTA domain-containing protein [Chitinophagaceae bacterium]MCA6485048.1 PASTA domain-containing protein [Chitinophagaceae bacterium]MCA6515803.1 PASTA domain-containing protein [Chitinophagaceae bacterium]